jgi:hypothetical protein|tara:strand:- start:1315 stop:1518 length:204 start_codon:yes stop_codon:yes gene_type:complete
MLFPQTERSVMDLIFSKGELSAFDPLDKNRFETQTMSLVSKMEKPAPNYIIINLIALGIFSLMVVVK